jgi:Uma2 family endonuclease
MSSQVARRYFTVDEYHRMAEAGIFSETDRIELIEGEVLRMSPIGSLHASCVKRLNKLLGQLVGQNAIISVQDPVQLDDFSEPEPDIALLRPRDDFYAQSHPQAADVLLIIEIADTSVDYDRNIKLPTYARSGIPEVLIANLPAETVEAYSAPGNGSYQRTRLYRRGESFSPEMLSGITIKIKDILG